MSKPTDQVAPRDELLLQELKEAVFGVIKKRMKKKEGVLVEEVAFCLSQIATEELFKCVQATRAARAAQAASQIVKATRMPKGPLAN